MPPRLLFSGLVDDAAVFPPRNDHIASALAHHLIWRGTQNGDLVGPLVCPLSRIEELCLALPIGAYVDVALVVDGDSTALAPALELIDGDPRVILVTVEAAHSRLGDAAADLGAMLARRANVTSCLEAPRGDLEETLNLIGPGSWQVAKFRTGGPTPDDFPSEAELAEFLLACHARGLAFKLTAGLHHAVRTHDPRTDSQQHGVLNVMIATEAVLDGDDQEVVAHVLASRSGPALVGAIKLWDTARCAAVRRSFRSFGCCDPSEPIADLHKLGLLLDWP